MKVYFSDDLPGQYANNRRYLQDILEEYAAFSNGNIRFEFFRPEEDQNVEQEAQKDLVDSGQENEEPVFDNTPFAGKTSKYEKFSDIKV